MLTSASSTNRDLLHSRPLDLHVWCLYPNINEFVNGIHEKYFLGNGQPEKNIGKHLLKKVLIDLYLAWLEDPDLCLAVDLNNNAYKRDIRYYKIHITKKIIPIIKRLAEHDLIDLVNGFYKRDGRSRKARIWPSLKLVGHFNNLEISRFYFTDGCYLLVSPKKRLSVAHMSEAEYRNVGVDRECIIRIKEIPDRKFQQKKIQIAYKDTPKISAMRADLMAYNRLLVQTHISLGFLDEPYLEVRGFTRRVKMKAPDNLHQRVKRISVNQNCKFTSREFSDKSWKQGGRYVGGWWQQIPSEYRCEIRINNKPTIELDYSEYYCALLYAEKGIHYWETSDKDPYALKEGKRDFFPGRKFLPENRITQKNQMSAINRRCVKLLFKLLLDAETLEVAYSAFRKIIRDNQPAWADRINWTNKHLNEITNSIRETHNPIAEYLGSGSGTKLHFADSEITAKLLKYFTTRGIVVLTLNGSYVVQEEYLEELKLIIKKLWSEEIQKLGAQSNKSCSFYKNRHKISPILKNIGNYQQPFDPERAKDSPRIKVFRSHRQNQKLSATFMREYMQFNAFCAHQGWPHNIPAYDFYKANSL